MSTHSRITLVAHRTLAPAVDALERASLWLEAEGGQPRIEVTSAERTSQPDRWPTVSRERLADGADAVVAFGGDGTLLDAASAIAHSPFDAPVLGINLGRLGFLTDASGGDWAAALASLVEGRVVFEPRLMLHGRVRRQGGVALDHLALNDIVVTRGALSRMIDIETLVNGDPVCVVRADGLIVASATGSTAYNLSAGGPILHPAVDAIVFTPIAPHTLTQRPLVLPASATVTLKPTVESGTNLVLTFDGQFGVDLLAGDVVEITRSARVIRLARTSARTHFDMLREKLKWGHV